MVNKDIKVDGKCIYSRGFSKNELNFAGQLFGLGGKLKNWRTIKNEYHLLKFKSFQWGQLVDALKTPWKQSIREQDANLNRLSLYEHHLIKKTKFVLYVNLVARNYIIFLF